MKKLSAYDGRLREWLLLEFSAVENDDNEWVFLSAGCSWLQLQDPGKSVNLNGRERKSLAGDVSAHLQKWIVLIAALANEDIRTRTLLESRLFQCVQESPRFFSP